MDFSTPSVFLSLTQRNVNQSSIVRDTALLLLAEWSVTTTVHDWAKLPEPLKTRTLKAAQSLPYKDSPRSKWEATKGYFSKVSPAKAVR